MTGSARFGLTLGATGGAAATGGISGAGFAGVFSVGDGRRRPKNGIIYSSYE
jgi:hypothetical protein